MNFIDTHTHLYLPQFSSDIDDVIVRSKKNKVTKMVLPNIDSKSIDPLKRLCEKQPDIFVPLMGLHPTHVKEDVENELKIILDEFENYTYYGVGEIGIDLYWDKTYSEEQQYAFRRQLNFAHERDMPVVIHARESLQEIFEVLQALNLTRFKGIFHAFTGNLHDANTIIEMGFFIGIGGIVTFRNSSLDDIVSDIDLNHIVLETDSPYLAPGPFRGKRNESSYIPYIAEKIAGIKNTTIEEVAEVTTLNARTIFNL